MVEAANEAGMKAEFVATPEEAGEWLARETAKAMCIAESVARREAGKSAGDVATKKRFSPSHRRRDLITES
jgi:hypothetical protein